MRYELKVVADRKADVTRSIFGRDSGAAAAEQDPGERGTIISIVTLRFCDVASHRTNGGCSRRVRVGGAEVRKGPLKKRGGNGL